MKSRSELRMRWRGGRYYVPNVMKAEFVMISFVFVKSILGVFHLLSEVRQLLVELHLKSLRLVPDSTRYS